MFGLIKLSCTILGGDDLIPILKIKKQTAYNGGSDQRLP